jgi:hypothetical protein
VANFSSDNVTILVGNGIGGYSQAAGSPVAVGDGPFAVAAGDLDGDGRADLVVPQLLVEQRLDPAGKRVRGIRPAAGSPIVAGAAPASVAIADFNGDGNADLAVANHNSNNVSILLGNGSGSFSPAAGSPIAVGASPQSIVAADLERRWQGRPRGDELLGQLEQRLDPSRERRGRIQ